MMIIQSLNPLYSTTSKSIVDPGDDSALSNLKPPSPIQSNKENKQKEADRFVHYRRATNSMTRSRIIDDRHRNASSSKLTFHSSGINCLQNPNENDHVKLISSATGKGATKGASKGRRPPSSASRKSDGEPSSLEFGRHDLDESSEAYRSQHQGNAEDHEQGTITRNRHEPFGSEDYNFQDTSTTLASDNKNNDNNHLIQQQETTTITNPDNHHQVATSSEQSKMVHMVDLPEEQPQREVLTWPLVEETCSLYRGSQRSERLNGTYLTYCSKHKIDLLFSIDILERIMHQSMFECQRVLSEFIRLDEQINKFYESFKLLLKRYNCQNGYSVKWNCIDCKRAYKDWLCTTNLPYYMNGVRIKPCISFCERVEQRCPYFHPITKEQYGGQPAFICKDPNIPFMLDITPDILHSDPNECYDLCHISDNKTEIKMDTLGNYGMACKSTADIAKHVAVEEKRRQEDAMKRGKTINMVKGHDCSRSSDEQYTTTFSSTSGGLNDYDYQEAKDAGDSKLGAIGDPDYQDNQEYTTKPTWKHSDSGKEAAKNITCLPPLHLEKLNILVHIYDSYKSQPKSQTFSHH